MYGSLTRFPPSGPERFPSLNPSDSSDPFLGRERAGGGDTSSCPSHCLVGAAGLPVDGATTRGDGSGPSEKDPRGLAGSGVMLVEPVCGTGLGKGVRVAGCRSCAGPKFGPVRTCGGSGRMEVLPRTGCAGGVGNGFLLEAIEMSLLKNGFAVVKFHQHEPLPPENFAMANGAEPGSTQPWRGVSTAAGFPDGDWVSVGAPECPGGGPVSPPVACISGLPSVAPEPKPGRR
jgi:hypothetical protein